MASTVAMFASPGGASGWHSSYHHHHHHHHPPPPTEHNDTGMVASRGGGGGATPAAAAGAAPPVVQVPPPQRRRSPPNPSSSFNNSSGHSHHRPRHPDSDDDDDDGFRPSLPKRSFSREEWERSIDLIRRIQDQEEQRRREQEEIDMSLALKLVEDSAQQQEHRDEELARALVLGGGGGDDEDHTRRRCSDYLDEQDQESYEQELRDMELARALLDESHRRRARCASLHPPTPLDELLKPCQLRAVRYVQERAQEMHNNALPTLMVRVVDMGFTPDDLQTCLNYIRDDAPIVVHIPPETLPKLVQDTHYRNLFEVHTSGGCKDKNKRRRWEATMFGNCYDDNEEDGSSTEECTTTTTDAVDRPKYGCLNVTGDLGGVRSAYRYGNCYMTLNEHVRRRATFFDKDTGGFVAERTLATNEHYAHILNGYNDFDLQAAMNVACNSRIGGARSWGSVYKEVQIHGPVCLATDIQALTLPGREVDATVEFRQAVLAFQNQTGCNILWQMDLLEPEEDI